MRNILPGTIGVEKDLGHLIWPGLANTDEGRPRGYPCRSRSSVRNGDGKTSGGKRSTDVCKCKINGRSSWRKQGRSLVSKRPISALGLALKE